MGQWFPGHIAKAEKELKEQLKLMDVVIEVRDGRIPMSTSHPQASIFISFSKFKNINFVKYPLRIDMNDVLCYDEGCIEDAKTSFGTFIVCIDRYTLQNP